MSLEQIISREKAIEIARRHMGDCYLDHPATSISVHRMYPLAPEEVMASIGAPPPPEDRADFEEWLHSRELNEEHWAVCFDPIEDPEWVTTAHSTIVYVYDNGDVE